MISGFNPHNIDGIIDDIMNSSFSQFEYEYNQWTAPLRKELKYIQKSQHVCNIGGLVKQIRNSTYGSVSIMNAIAYDRDLYKHAIKTIHKKNMGVYAFLGTLSKPQLVAIYNRVHGHCAW